MHDPAFERHPTHDALAAGDLGSLAQERPILGLRGAERTRHVPVDLTIAYRDPCDIGAAKPGGRFDHCVQHRLHIGGRAADDIEHVAGRGLVFERFFEVARAGLQFTEQPRVLDRDHRLGRKVLQQRDLFVGEWSYLTAVGSDIAEKNAVLAQRHQK